MCIRSNEVSALGKAHQRGAANLRIPQFYYRGYVPLDAPDWVYSVPHKESRPAGQPKLRRAVSPKKFPSPKDCDCELLWSFPQSASRVQLRPYLCVANT